MNEISRDGSPMSAIDEAKKNYELTDSQKWEQLRGDQRLKDALSYIQHLMDVSAFPGGPNGELEKEVRRGLVNLGSGVESGTAQRSSSAGLNYSNSGGAEE